MPLAALALALLWQQPATQIQLGTPLEATILETSPEVHTAELDAHYQTAPTRGLSFAIAVEESGPYFFDLRSYEFDAYLVLESGDGVVIAEDDDGLVRTHSRISVELEAGKPYQLTVCALHGQVGKCVVDLSRGQPAPMSEKETLAAIAADDQAKLEFFESQYSDDQAKLADILTREGIHYYNRQEDSSARIYLLRALEIYVGIDPDDRLTALAYFNMAGVARFTDGPKIALPYAQKSLSIMEKLSNISSQDLAECLDLIGLVHQGMGDLPTALEYFQRGLEKLRIGSHEIADYEFRVVSRIAKAQVGLGQNQEVVETWQSYVQETEKHYGPNHMKTLGALNAAGDFFQDEGRFEESLPYYRAGLRAAENLTGEQRRYWTVIANNLAFAYRELDQLDEALSLYQQSKEIYDQLSPPWQTDDLEILLNYADAIKDSGDLEQAEALVVQIIENSDPNLKDQVELIGKGYFRMGIWHLEAYQFIKAEDYLGRSYQSRKPLLGEGAYETCRSYVEWARALDQLGQSERAVSMFREAIVRLEKIRGLQSLEVVVHTELCDALVHLGRFEQARNHAEIAVEFAREFDGELSDQYITALKSLGEVRQKQGDLVGARRAFQQRLELAQKIYGEDQHNLAGPYRDLAYFHWKGGEPERARKGYQKAFDLRRDFYGKEHILTLSSLNDLYLFTDDQDGPESALPLIVEVARGMEAIMGPGHPSTVKAKMNLAIAYRNLGEFDQALELKMAALDACRLQYGNHHPLVAKVLNHIGSNLIEMGRPAEGYPYCEESFRLTLDHFESEFPTMSEAGRINFLQASINPHNLIACLAGMGDGNLIPAMELFLRWKGMATRMQAANLVLRQQAQTESGRRQVAEIQEVAKELSTLIMQPLERQAPDHAQAVRDLQSKRIELERKLNAEFGLDEVFATPSPSQVLDGMPKGSILLDFFVDAKISVWVLDYDGNNSLHTFGSADEIRSLQNAFLSDHAVRGGRQLERSEDDLEAEFYAQVWSRVEAYVDGAETVLISPDSFLCELPFGILRNPDGQYLLEKHRFVYLSDATVLAKKQRATVHDEGPVFAVGGVNYFRRDNVGEVATNPVSTRSNIGSSWSSLSATRQELATLRDLHDFILEWDAPLTILEGKSATEEAVRAQMPGNRFVHIATHGYFEPDHLPSLRLNLDAPAGANALDAQVEAVGMLPGLLSGLVLAGVNGEPDPNRDDGFLSAEEIHHMDLSSCALVVLSACETALGSERAGEGLMSLRRAFEVAGAEAVISSLWKVDDLATAELMKDFYMNLWAKGMSRAEALHQAKLTILQRNRLENGGDALPNTWGAFVLSGGF